MLPDREVTWARVQVFDQDGHAVWYSLKKVAAEVTWNGVGSEGSYTGLMVPEGDYHWRVKFEFPDSLEARSNRRHIILQ